MWTAVLLLELTAHSATVGYWRFEGNLGDSSGAAVPGTSPDAMIYGAPPAPTVPSTGAANSSGLQFSGLQTVSFAQDFVLHDTTDATVELFLRFTPTSHQSLFWTREGGTDLNRFNITLNSTGHVYSDYRGPLGTLHDVSNTTAGAPFTAGVWRHFAITRTVVDGNTHRYDTFLDGVFVSSMVDVGPVLPNAPTWTLGGRDAYPLVGEIDELRLSDHVRAPADFLDADPSALRLVVPSSAIAGTPVELRVEGATPGARIGVGGSLGFARSTVPGCPGLVADLDSAVVVGTGVADASGVYATTVTVPLVTAGQRVLLQAADLDGCVRTRTVSLRSL